MRETGFIEQNKEKWEEFEKVLKEKERDPDSLSNLFIQITDDLSYARTFYPNRSVRVYLNHLAQQIFSNIYKRKRSKRGAFADFWRDHMPQVMLATQRELLISFLIFAIAVGVGMLSSAYDPAFLEVVLGEQYVEMTKENIESGDPMAVYKKSKQFDMFLRITWNNVLVAFFTFILGALFSVGTVYILISNGIMLGAFQYFFIARGLFWESFLTIWVHGTLEISAIIIAGAAGLAMGRGLIFPGTYTRLQSFQVSASKGAKIMLSIVPIFITAGFLEGFVTRYTEVPDFLRGFLIAACLFFILGYFVFYPMIKARNGFANPIQDKKFPPSPEQKLNFTTIRTNGELFSDIFVLFRKYAGRVSLLALLLATAYTLLLAFHLVEGIRFDAQLDSSFAKVLEVFFGYLGEFSSFFDYQTNTSLLVVNTIVIWMVSLFAFYFVRLEATGKSRGKMDWKDFRSFTLKHGLQLLALVTLVNMYLLIDAWFVSLGLLLLLPIFLFYGAVIHLEEANPIKALQQTFSYIKGGFGKWAGLYFVQLLVGMLIMGFLGSGLLYFFFDVLKSFILLDQDSVNRFYNLFFAWNAIFGFAIILHLMVSGMGILYYTLREMVDAPDLRERIENMGNKRTVYGIRQVE